MRFSPDGRIVEGGNRNEHSWRVLDGQLELLQADGTVHSRFNYSPGHGMFFHTNDPDTKSLRDQYMAPEETQS
jgi:hypothetical protein